MGKTIRLQKKRARRNLKIATHLIHAYLASRDGLKELGILRSERTLQGDYAEWIAANFLDLTLSDSPVQKGVDAKDSRGRTYQIKSRVIPDLNHGAGFTIRHIGARFDYLLCVLFDPEFDVLAIARIPYSHVKKISRAVASGHRLRWTRRSFEDPKIEMLYRIPDENP